MSEERVLLGLALTTTAISATFLLAKRRKDESLRSAAELLIQPALNNLNNAGSNMAPTNDGRNVSPRSLQRSFSEGERTYYCALTC